MSSRLKLSIAGLCVFATIAVLAWHKRPPSTFDIPIRKSPKYLPVVDAEFENGIHPICLSLSSHCPLSLDEKLLASLRKSIDKAANSSETTGYRIPYLRLASLTQKEVLTRPANHSHLDSEGCYSWPFDDLNLLLDLPHMKIIGVKQTVDLKRLGYDLNKMTSVECERTKQGLLFTLNTPDGPLPTTLATNCNHNLIRATPSSPNHVNVLLSQETPEAIACTPYPTPAERAHDLILGTPFLGQHIVYIDAKRNRLYIGDRFASSITHQSPTLLKLEMTPGGCPAFDLDIGGQAYTVMLDTGSSAELSIQPNSVATEPLTFVRDQMRYNIKGDEYPSALYILPQCRLGKASASNLYLTIQKMPKVKTGYKSSQSFGDAIPAGYLGFPFLNRTNVHLDLVNHSLWLIDRSEDLRKINIHLNDYHRVPFSLKPCGMVLSCKTDLGTLSLLLDTGSSLNAVSLQCASGHDRTADLDSNPTILTKSFSLNGYDYGPQNLYPFEITSKFGPIDGILGVDFLKKHPCYIDYRNRAIYFKRPS